MKIKTIPQMGTIKEIEKAIKEAKKQGATDYHVDIENELEITCYKIAKDAKRR